MVLKLITFDVTGTLLTFRHAVGYQYARIASLYGINAKPDILSENFKMVFKKMLVDYPNFGESSIGWSDWWKILVFDTFQNSLPPNALLDKSTMNKISSDLIGIYETRECWKVAEGAEDLLQKLRFSGIKLAVISNYDPRLECILKNLDLLKYFDFVLTSYSAKCTKPHPAIFETVERNYCDIRKNEILHVGDNPQLDFIAAKNIGWNALLVAEDINMIFRKHPDIPKDWVVKHIFNIYDTLNRNKMLGTGNIL